MAFKNTDRDTIRVIFFTQLILLIILPVLFLTDHAFDKIDLGSFFFAIDMGSLGASVSLLKRIKENDLTFKSESKNLKVFAILIPVLYGTVMAGIAYLLFMSGILTGEGGEGLLTSNLFPNFTRPITASLLDQFLEMRPASMKDTGKLLVWCFIAGYSEKFVTGVLRQLEKQSFRADENES